MNKDSKTLRVRHSSLDMPDVEAVKKKQDVFTKARNKLFNFGDHRNKNSEIPDSPTKKAAKPSAIESLCKATQKPIESIVQSSANQSSKLLKQNSISGYPIEIQIEEYDDVTISRDRPATICVDKIDRNLNTAALALERPRKKLSFQEPERVTCTSKTLDRDLRYRRPDTNTLLLPSSGMKRSVSFTNGLIRRPTVDEFDLESQAMRVVRTVGQAFEVCHKLSITAPENENLDQEEQETLTQDLMSDRLSDVTSDRGRKDFQSETDMERMSLAGCEETSFKDPQENKSSRLAMPRQLDLLPNPPASNYKQSSLISNDPYTSPQSDILMTESSGMNSSLGLAGNLSSHHEIQLLREQLEQQNQQTQAAMAQLQLAREQLAAEQAARVEAQSRTHQLLVHNRELLDHIAALVSHLQTGSEKSGAAGSQQQNSAHVTLPQHQPSGVSDNYMPDYSETTLDNSLQQALGLNPQGLIENRAVTSCLPLSPLAAYNPAGSMFNFPYSPEATFENQLLQRLQSLSGYTPPSPYPFNFNPSLPYFQSPYYPTSNLLNNNFALSQAPQNFPASSLGARHSFAENQMQGVRHSSEPRQIPYQYHSNFTKPPTSLHLQNYSHTLPNDAKEKKQMPQMNQHSPPTPTQNTRNSPLRGVTPRPSSYIRPLSQVGTFTTTDSGGKVRVIVPVPSEGSSSNSINNNRETEGLLANLKLTDDFRNGPPIQRSTSEKVPHKSELMAQVQRAMWARHTTK